MFLAAGGVPQVSRAASITQAHTSTNPLEQRGWIVLLWLRHAQRTRYEHQADANLCQASSCSPALLSALRAAGNFLPFCSASGSWHPSATYPAEHQSLATERWASFQSAFIFWIIYFWLHWTSSNQVYLLKLNLRGKKDCLPYPAWVQDQQHLLDPICVHKMQWLRLEATLLVTCATPAQAGSPWSPPGMGAPQPPWSLLQPAATSTSGEMFP